jgi:hypothetical protein
LTALFFTKSTNSASVMVFMLVLPSRSHLAWSVTVA